MCFHLAQWAVQDKTPAKLFSICPRTLHGKEWRPNIQKAMDSDSCKRLCKVIPINFSTAAQGVLYLVSFTNCLKRALVTGVSSMLYAWKAIPHYISLPFLAGYRKWTKTLANLPQSTWWGSHSKGPKSQFCTSKETCLVPGAPDSSSPPIVKLRAWFCIYPISWWTLTSWAPELESSGQTWQREKSLRFDPRPQKKWWEDQWCQCQVFTWHKGESPTEPPKHQGRPERIRQSDRWLATSSGHFVNSTKYPTVPWFLAATSSMFLHEFSPSIQFVFGFMTRSVLAAVHFLIISGSLHCNAPLLSKVIEKSES